MLTSLHAKSLANMALAMEYYTSKGFKYIDTPWIIPEEPHAATVPFDQDDNRYYDNKLPDGFLVGSAEQGFIHEWTDDAHSFQLNSKYMSFSPCFRSEGKYDIYHKRYFLKLELFIPVHHFTETVLTSIIDDAYNFFTTNGKKVKVIKIDDTQSDIVTINTGAELGSYGFRIYHPMNLQYFFGTGIAEPRFSCV